MEFTGERFMPSEAGQIRHEHMHRYAWCCSLVRGKTVLDIACGEGYGSAMLARHAAGVTGVDIAEEAVEHAKHAYRDQDNLTFLQGNAAAIPLPDASVDVVVSFETIEHHDRHQEMISEIRRVLRADGVLIISSPNRLVYSEQAGYHNEFHVKELDFGEFDGLLRQQFGNIRYYGQRLAVGSALFALQPEDATKSVAALTDTGTDIVERSTCLIDPIYFVAVATTGDIPLPAMPSSVLFSEAEDLYTHHREVAAWAQRLSVEHADALDQILHLTKGREAAQLEAQIATKGRAAAQLEAEAAIKAREAARMEAEAAVKGRETAQLEAQLARQEIHVVEQKAQAAFQEAEGMCARQRAELIEARGEVAKRNARIQQLEEAREELELIKSSRSWRLTRPLRVALRLLRHRGLGAEDREKLRQLWRRGAAMPVESLPPPMIVTAAELSAVGDANEQVMHVMPQAAGRRDYFIWSVIDWHFRTQRPQHLARELAKAGHRVFYISNNFIDHPAAGFAVESLDDSGCLFQVNLHAKGRPAIYHAAPSENIREQLRAGIGQLLAWTSSRACVSLVQHPYWLETARVLPNAWLAYDCMDHHGGFADNGTDMLVRENELMRTADLLVVTSDWLYEEAGKYNPHRLMIRNACQYEHFAAQPEHVFKDAQGRKVIGYYGAIAEWFDLDLLEKVAKRFTDCLVLMVGADTAGAQKRLQHLDNVVFTGEVAYAKLPFYLAGFDVCLLPFQVIPLTLATNPVKVYEYLSAGKEVVSIALPEIRQFGDLVRTAGDHAGFLAAVAAALNAWPDAARIAQRQHFAEEQTWSHRVQDLLQGIAALPEPRVSVVVVTYNNLDLTQLCLRSLELYSSYENLEVIVVDNASADGSPAWLREWAAAGADRHLILNPDNRGFAAANNQGLALASGDYLVMLNNDTHVTPGWIATLVAHLRHDPSLGMLGPVTNNIGNEARIAIQYDDMDGMLSAAADYTAHHAGQLTSLRTAAFFCVMMPRAVYEKVGPLDEAFGIGFFEDDDYCRRVEQAGWTIACADDVFIHHNLSASFNKLKQEKRQALFEQNKAIYEKKWGTWVPHKYRGE
jgi:GT2 family glycosyltransferase/glycosyltransferase involved in cell wall biosynthesis